MIFLKVSSQANIIKPFVCYMITCQGVGGDIANDKLKHEFWFDHLCMSILVSVLA